MIRTTENNLQVYLLEGIGGDTNYTLFFQQIIKYFQANTELSIYRGEHMANNFTRTPVSAAYLLSLR